MSDFSIQHYTIVIQAIIIILLIFIIYILGTSRGRWKSRYETLETEKEINASRCMEETTFLRRLVNEKAAIAVEELSAQYPY